MNYCTPEFALLLIAALLLHRGCRAAGWWQGGKWVLLTTSYLFYSFWYYPYALLLLGSTALDYLCAARIDRATDPTRKRRWLYLSLAGNLGVLFVFKYLAATLTGGWQLLTALGFDTPQPEWDVLLPIGISFYTFQSMSYTIDVYNGLCKPVDRFADFALFVSCLSQLVAGPIVRAREFLPQLMRPRSIRWAYVNWGAFLILLGCFKKMVLADNIALYVDWFFAQPEYTAFHAQTCWLVMIAYGAQFYADFSGYSDIAIGTAYLFGYKIPYNFYYPWLALGFSNFWQRWNITLSRWFRDYLYTPLAYNRAHRRWVTEGEGRGRRIYSGLRNLTLTMFLVGLWHGPAITFVAFGLLHGAYLALDHLWLRGVVMQARETGGASGWLRMNAVRIFTFLAVIQSLVLFRSQTLAQAWNVTVAMFTHWNPATVSYERNLYWAQYWIIIYLMHLAAWAWHGDALHRRYPKWVYFVSAQVMVICLLFFRGASGNAFIYFRF